MTLKEILAAYAEDKTVQRQNSNGSWSDLPLDDFGLELMLFDSTSKSNYRIKPTLKRVPLTREDFTPGIWWLLGSESKNLYLVTSFTQDGISCGEAHVLYFKDLSESRLERSQNPNGPWLPCYKEVEE